MTTNKRNIFFDNNATTPISLEVLSVITHSLKTIPGNPSSITNDGRFAKNQLITARKKIATFLGSRPGEIIFTSGGTESIYTLIHGICKNKKKPIITTSIEHKSVLYSIEDTALTPKFLSVDQSYTPSIDELLTLLDAGASAIVLSLVNGETGSLLPVKDIAEIAYRYNVPLILDGVAALGKMPIHLYKGITAIAFSGHKCHGPKGTGFFYLSSNYPFFPTFRGGMQENGFRSGTENVAGILGLTKAIEEITEDRYTYLADLRKAFETKVTSIFPTCRINGGENRVSNVSNIFFEDIDGDHLLIYLDQNGITASLGSACSSGSLEPSHVLLGMGYSRKYAGSSLRFSFSSMNNLQEIDEACEMLRVYKDSFSAPFSFNN